MVIIQRVGTLCAAYGLSPEAMLRIQDELTYTQLESQQIRGRSIMVARPVRMWDHQQDGSLIFMSGYLERVCRLVESLGDTIESVTRLDRTDTLRVDVKAAAAASFRPEQLQMLQAIVGFDDGQLVVGTGGGKTYLMRELPAIFPDARIVMAAPSTETVRTLHRYLCERWGADNVGMVGAGSRHTRRVTVSTYHSLMAVDQIDKCDILLADELHRAAAKSFSKTFSALSSPLKRFGLTATADGRFDKSEWLIEGLFGPIRVDLGYQDSVQSGSVLPIHVLAVKNEHGPPPDEIDARVNMVSRDRMALWANLGRNRLIAEATEILRAKYNDPQTLVLVDKLEHAIALKALMPDYELFHGTVTPDRKAKLLRRYPELENVFMSPADRAKKLAAFEAGQLRRVIGTAVLGTGVSANECQLVVIASGSGATISFRQNIGRGSRLSDGKDHAVAVMFEDVFHRAYKGRSMKLLATANREGHHVHRLDLAGLRAWLPPQKS